MVDTNPLVGFYPIVLDIPMPISPNFMAVHHAQKTIETTVAAHFAPAGGGRVLMEPSVSQLVIFLGSPKKVKKLEAWE